jgi:excinuclease ABC subunit C
LDKNSETLRVLQQIRNEAHRFGITFHRNKRSKEFIISELTQIPGIGEKTIELLMRRFKSITRLRSSPLSEIIEQVGASRADKIEKYFNSNPKTDLE